MYAKINTSWHSINFTLVSGGFPLSVGDWYDELPKGTKTITSSFTAHVGSATKLQTTRTIWGQNFDGTENVSGTLTGVNEIYGSGGIHLTSDGWIPIQITRSNLGTSNIGGVDGNGVYFAHEKNSITTYMYLKAGTGLTVHSNVKANGFIKNNSDDSYILLGGGGHYSLNNVLHGNSYGTMEGVISDCNSVSVTGIYSSGEFSNRPDKVTNWGTLFNLTVATTRRPTAPIKII